MTIAAKQVQVQAEEAKVEVVAASPAYLVHRQFRQPAPHLRRRQQRPPSNLRRLLEMAAAVTVVVRVALLAKAAADLTAISTSAMVSYRRTEKVSASRCGLC